MDKFLPRVYWQIYLVIVCFKIFEKDGSVVNEREKTSLVMRHLVGIDLVTEPASWFNCSKDD